MTTEVAVDDSNASQLSSSALATCLGLVSAVGYTVSNICLRAVTEVDPFWVSCIKAVPTFVAVFPFMILQRLKSERWFPSWKIFWVICCVAVVGQIVGNVGFQWALGIIGLALDVPIVMGTMIVGGALLGRWILNDQLSARMFVAASILIVAICVLGFGADQAQEVISVDSEKRPKDSKYWLTFAGVAVSALSGIAYCFLSIGIRFATQRGTGPLPILGVVSFIGMIGLGSISLSQHDVAVLFGYPPNTYLWMILAGVFNFIAFWALAKSLHLASVFFINSLNATQIGMAALAGIVLFGEPLTISLLTGIGMTIFGLLIMKGRR